MASWLTNQPVILGKTQEKSGDRIVWRVRVQFADDGTPQKVLEKEYLLSGSDVLDQLKRLTYDEQQELQSGESVTAGAITPVAPTPAEAAITAYQLASQRIDALNRLVGRMGWTESSVIFTGRTVAQVRTSLQNATKADLTSDARITIALDNTH